MEGSLFCKYNFKTVFKLFMNTFQSDLNFPNFCQSYNEKQDKFPFLHWWAPLKALESETSWSGQASRPLVGNVETGLTFFGKLCWTFWVKIFEISFSDIGAYSQEIVQWGKKFDWWPPPRTSSSTRTSTSTSTSTSTASPPKQHHHHHIPRLDQNFPSCNNCFMALLVAPSDESIIHLRGPFSSQFSYFFIFSRRLAI